MACLGDATQICGGHLTLVAYTKPTQITYKGVIQVFSGATSLGYMQIDPNYWTPMLTPDITAAVPLSFQGPSGATSFSNIGFSISGTFPFLGLVAGRDSTSSNIATGSFNYLYIDQMEPTAPGATPQSVPSFFATSSGLNKQGESNDWSVDLISGAVTAQWINTDSSKFLSHFQLFFLPLPFSPVIVLLVFYQEKFVTHTPIQVCRPRYFSFKAITSMQVETPMHSTAGSLLPLPPLLSNGSRSRSLLAHGLILRPTILTLFGRHPNLGVGTIGRKLWAFGTRVYRELEIVMSTN